MSAPDDKIGYRRPPKASRFSKGVSGNPKGRPKKLKSVDDQFADYTRYSAGEMALTELRRLRTVTIDGRPQQRTGSEILMHVAFARAMGGSRLHMKWLLDLAEHERKAREAVDRQRFVDLYGHKLDGERRIARARARGEPEPALYPHPDDIQTGSGTYQIWVSGPESAEEMIEFERARQQVELLLWISAQRAMAGKTNLIRQGRNSGCALAVLATIANNMLPVRMRYSEEAMLTIMLDAAHSTQSEIDARISALTKTVDDLSARTPPLPDYIKRAVKGFEQRLDKGEKLKLAGN